MTVTNESEKRPKVGQKFQSLAPNSLTSPLTALKIWLKICDACEETFKEASPVTCITLQGSEDRIRPNLRGRVQSPTIAVDTTVKPIRQKPGFDIRDQHYASSLNHSEPSGV